MISASRLAAVAFVGLTPFLSISTASAVGVQLFAILQGGHEIPGPGAPKGHGAASVTFSGATSTKVCVAIVVDGITSPTAAHIRRPPVRQALRAAVSRSPRRCRGVSGPIRRASTSTCIRPRSPAAPFAASCSDADPVSSPAPETIPENADPSLGHGSADKPPRVGCGGTCRSDAHRFRLGRRA
jgi:hypothetical protein